MGHEVGTPRERRAMARALELARRGPRHDPNPRVGCVLLVPDGSDHPEGSALLAPGPRPDPATDLSGVLAEGWHRGARTPHAEVAALTDARAHGIDVRGATAVVTLEPCAHTGRTGPCARALIEAGIARVVIGVEDPSDLAGGGARLLREAGLEVITGVLREDGLALLGHWYDAARLGRPWVILKTATTLDGRVAAADGSSRWITGPEARVHAHRVRAEVDALVVGSGTLAHDDPSLTARTSDIGEIAGEVGAGAARSSGAGDDPTVLTPSAAAWPAVAATPHQPLRVIIGRRSIPRNAAVRRPGGGLIHLRTHDPAKALAALVERGVHDLVLEGGPTLATAFLRAGLVDELHAYIAPVVLGAGARAVGDLGIGSISDARRFATHAVERLGDDVLIVARPVGTDPIGPDGAVTPRLRVAATPPSSHDLLSAHASTTKEF